MIFQIKSRNKDTEFISGSKVFMTGEPNFIDNNFPMRREIVDLEKGIFQYRTGFKPIEVETNPAFSNASDKELEKKNKDKYEKIAKSLREFILKSHPQAENDQSGSFWNTSRTNLRIDTNTLVTKFFDTDTVEDAIRYLAIIGGGFPQVSLTEDLAFENQNKFYITSKEDFISKEIKAKFGGTRKAFVHLNTLLEEKGKSDLVYFAYLIPALKSNGFTFNTSNERLEESFMEYISGDLTKVDKKKPANDFITLYDLYESDKEEFIGQSIIEAGIHFGLIYKQKGAGGNYVNGLTHNQLGGKVKEIYKKLVKPENTEEFKELIEKTKEYLNK